MTERHMPSMQITLRNAEADEADTIAALIQRANAEYEPNYAPEAWQRYFAMLANVAPHFQAADVIVAEREDVLAGVVMFYRDGSLSGQGEWPARWAGILRLSVDPAHRGAGIGRMLTAECVRRAREAGVSTLALHATRWMTVSRAMYERMGFVRDESFDFTTRSGVLAMGYRLDLNAP